LAKVHRKIGKNSVAQTFFDIINVKRAFFLIIVDLKEYTLVIFD